MRSIERATVQANPPCHPRAEQREGVLGIPVGVRADGQPMRGRIHCPQCGRPYIVTTRRAGRKVIVDWDPDA